jgi:polyhydroxyalkanoate synthase
MDKEFRPIVNAAEMNRGLARIAQRSSEAVAEFLQRQANDATLAAFFDPLHIGDAFQQMTAQILASPVRIVEAQMSLWNNYLQLWQHTARSMMGEAVPPLSDTNGIERWNESELFDFIRQSYLMTARWIQTLLKSNGSLGKSDAHTVDFYTRQFIDGMSAPSFFAANEELRDLTVETYGNNLLLGLDHVLRELERGKGSKLTRSSGGVTPGQIVFSNDSMDLLRHCPTGKTRKLPLLIVPPWNAKPYLLDLTPKHSFVKWALEQGHDLFILSWKAPEGALAEREFADTLNEGPLAALDAIEKLTGYKRINGLGFGLGGTLLASTLGWLAAVGQDRFASATYLGTLIDFFEVGEISVFINEEIMRVLDLKRSGKAPIDRSALSATVNSLRANDLIWSFVLDSYLDATTPLPVELLRWNADSLNLCTATQDFYLRALYQRNLLAEPGGLMLQGTPIDLGGITAPSYVLAGSEDHIAPWKTAFAATRLFSGPVRFVLASGGHAGSILTSRGYWSNERRVKDPQGWLKNATHKTGSWWEDWAAWVAPMT